jgi:hypothetical protein
MSIPVNEMSMSMESLKSFGFDRKVGFDPKGCEGFLNPKSGFGWRSRCDPERHHACSIEGLRREVFETRNTRTKPPTNFVPPGIVRMEG